MAQLGVMWLSCDPLSDSLFVISCGSSFNAAHVIKLTLRFCVKNIFKSTLTYKRSYKNSTSVHGEVNKLLSNDSTSTIKSVQSCQQKVKNDDKLFESNWNGDAARDVQIHSSEGRDSFGSYSPPQRQSQVSDGQDNSRFGQSGKFHQLRYLNENKRDSLVTAIFPQVCRWCKTSRNE